MRKGHQTQKHPGASRPVNVRPNGKPGGFCRLDPTANDITEARKYRARSIPLTRIDATSEQYSSHKEAARSPYAKARIIFFRVMERIHAPKTKTPLPNEGGRALVKQLSSGLDLPPPRR